jgi:hypothetical protein
MQFFTVSTIESLASLHFCIKMSLIGESEKYITGKFCGTNPGAKQMEAI